MIFKKFLLYCLLSFDKTLASELSMPLFPEQGLGARSIPDVFRQANIEESRIRHIVVFCPNRMLGDTLVLCLPKILAARERFPNAELHVLSPWAHLLSPHLGMTLTRIEISHDETRKTPVSFFYESRFLDQYFSAHHFEPGKILLVLDQENSGPKRGDFVHIDLPYEHSPLALQFYSRRHLIFPQTMKMDKRSI